MKVTEIVSPDNQRLKLIRALVAGRQKDEGPDGALFLIEGNEIIQEALNKKVELVDVIASEVYFKNDLNGQELLNKIENITVVPDRLFKGLYSTDTSCGVIATAKKKSFELDQLIRNALHSKMKTLLLADNIQDPGNLGTIIRESLMFS